MENISTCIEKLLKNSYGSCNYHPGDNIGSPAMPRTQALHSPQETTLPGRRDPAFYNVLGSRICALTLDRTITMLAERVARRQPAYVSVCPVRTVVAAFRGPA